MPGRPNSDHIVAGAGSCTPSGCWWRVGTCLDLLCCLSEAERERERERRGSTLLQREVTKLVGRRRRSPADDHSRPDGWRSRLAARAAARAPHHPRGLFRERPSGKPPLRKLCERQWRRRRAPEEEGGAAGDARLPGGRRAGGCCGCFSGSVLAGCCEE